MLFHFLFSLRVEITNVTLSSSDANLHFVESPALAPPEVQIDMAAQEQYVFSFLLTLFVRSVSAIVPMIMISLRTFVSSSPFILKGRLPAHN